MPLFGNKREASLRVAVKMVEEVISELGLSPADSRLEAEDGGPAWGLGKGSARVFIFLHSGEGEQTDHALRVLAPVVDPPEDPAAQLALYHHLLGLNASALRGAAFGRKGRAVVLTAERGTRDLDRSEVKEMILGLGYYADRYDDLLIEQFGARRRTD